MGSDDITSCSMCSTRWRPSAGVLRRTPTTAFCLTVHSFAPACFSSASPTRSSFSIGGSSPPSPPPPPHGGRAPRRPYTPASSPPPPQPQSAQTELARPPSLPPDLLASPVRPPR